MSRFLFLEHCYLVFKETGIHLMIKTSSGYGFPVAADDLGYTFYTTLLASGFNLSVYEAGNWLFNGFLILSLLILGITFFCISRTLFGNFVITLCLIRLLMPIIFLNHVYIAYLFGVVPLGIVLLADYKKSSKLLKVAFFSAGIISSIANIIRILSAFPTIVFCGIYCFSIFYQKPFQKILLFGLFLIGYGIPYAHYNYHLTKRNTFLIKQGVEIPNDTQKHVFWHNIYTGLGFLNNDQNITWSDSCAAKKALEINPEAKYPSRLYETTIRNEIFRLCKEKRYFVATIIFAKLGVVLYFFLIYFGWIGILASWFYPKPWYLEFAFWSALGVSTLPGILTLPVTPYLIGFVTCTILYTIYSSIWAFNKGVVDDLEIFFNHIIKKWG